MLLLTVALLLFLRLLLLLSIYSVLLCTACCYHPESAVLKVYLLHLLQLLLAV
jgi:hypothetical protein